MLAFHSLLVVHANQFVARYQFDILYIIFSVPDSNSVSIRGACSRVLGIIDSGSHMVVGFEMFIVDPGLQAIEGFSVLFKIIENIFRF